MLKQFSGEGELLENTWKYSEKTWGHGFIFLTGLFSKVSFQSPHIEKLRQDQWPEYAQRLGGRWEDRKLWMSQTSFWEPIASSLSVVVGKMISMTFLFHCGGYVVV